MKIVDNIMPRVGKIESILAAAVPGTVIGKPDSATFVKVYFESDTDKICVLKSDGTIVKTVALT